MGIRYGAEKVFELTADRSLAKVVGSYVDLIWSMGEAVAMSLLAGILWKVWEVVGFPPTAAALCTSGGA